MALIGLYMRQQVAIWFLTVGVLTALRQASDFGPILIRPTM